MAMRSVGDYIRSGAGMSGVKGTIINPPLHAPIEVGVWVKWAA